MSKYTLFSGRLLPFFMWLLPLMFFAHQFILRLWPGLMMHQIIEQFSIDATLFGMLASSYYYGYAGMQIPIAILLSKFGTRIVVCVFAILCGSATIVFTYTDNFYIALVSRFFIGVGSAAGFLSVSQVVAEWFSKDQYSKMIGFSFTIGLMGAVYGGKPVGVLVEKYLWKNVALSIGLTSIMLGIIAYLFLRQNDTRKNVTATPLQISDLKSIFSSKVIWCIAISNLLMVGALEGFADVWGVQYLSMLYHIDRSDAAGLISFIFLGMLVGGPLLAALSDKLGKYVVIGISGLGMALIFVLLIAHQIELSFVPYFFFLVGIMCCYQVLIFAVGSELVPAKNLGICVAFLNSINMLGGSFFHSLIGIVIDLFWNGKVNADGLRVYEEASYQYALAVIPACAVIGGLVFLTLWLKGRITKI